MQWKAGHQGNPPLGSKGVELYALTVATQLILMKNNYIRVLACSYAFYMLNLSFHRGPQIQPCQNNDGLKVQFILDKFHFAIIPNLNHLKASLRPTMKVSLPQIVREASYPSSENDISRPPRRLLGRMRSKERKRRLGVLLLILVLGMRTMVLVLVKTMVREGVKKKERGRRRRRRKCIHRSLHLNNPERCVVSQRNSYFL